MELVRDQLLVPREPGTGNYYYKCKHGTIWTRCTFLGVEWKWWILRFATKRDRNSKSMAISRIGCSCFPPCNNPEAKNRSRDQIDMTYLDFSIQHGIHMELMLFLNDIDPAITCQYCGNGKNFNDKKVEWKGRDMYEIQWTCNRCKKQATLNFRGKEMKRSINRAITIIDGNASLDDFLPRATGR